MWKCGNVEMWKCGNVEMWKCGNVEMWKCGNVEMWKCGNVEMWKCGNVHLELHLFHGNINFWYRYTSQYYQLFSFSCPLSEVPLSLSLLA